MTSRGIYTMGPKIESWPTKSKNGRIARSGVFHRRKCPDGRFHCSRANSHSEPGARNARPGVLLYALIKSPGRAIFTCENARPGHFLWKFWSALVLQHDPQVPQIQQIHQITRSRNSLVAGNPGRRTHRALLSKTLNHFTKPSIGKQGSIPQRWMRNEHAQGFGNYFWVEEIRLNLELKSATLTARSRQNRNHACKLKSRKSLDLRNYSKLPRPGK